MRNYSYAVGIDFGGSSMKAVAVTPEGQLLERQSVPTHDDIEHLIPCVRETVSKFEMAHGAPRYIGLAAPGFADVDGRCILWMRGWLEALVGVEWAPLLGTAARVPVLNDAHAHLMGEKWLGAARDCHHALLLTLGTGVGGAVLSEGRILKGRTGRAGHLGHISLDPDGSPDIFSTPGSLEDAIGNCRIQNRSNGRFASTEELVRAHLAGDPFATEVWLQSIKALAAALASYINVFDPELIILGGGVMKAGDALLMPLKDYLDAMEWRPLGEAVPLAVAELGDYAGAFGAAHNAIQLGA